MENKSNLYRQGVKVFWGLVIMGTLLLTFSEAAQTGKIKGRVVDANTKEPLPGANVYIESIWFDDIQIEMDEKSGAAADGEGDYFIINISPGIYTVVCKMIGYQTTRMEKVKVESDRSVRLNFQVEESFLDIGEEVTVVANKGMIQRDLTSSVSTVSADDIGAMPVESFQEVLELQAGVVTDQTGGMHIRGGRSDEVAYLIDGVSITNPFYGAAALNIDHNSIQELKVISGTFNAEYGQVMSGIVEIVTKKPEEKLRWGGSLNFGDYVSANDDLFYGIDELNPISIHNGEFFLSGPLPKISKKIGYYLSFRKSFNDGWLYGERIFNPKDSSSFDPQSVIIEKTGDGDAISMNSSQQYYWNMKIRLNITDNSFLTYSFIGNHSDLRQYDHRYRLNPDGNGKSRNKGLTHILSFEQSISQNSFFTLKASSFQNEFKYYKYKDKRDKGYANPQLFRNVEDAYSFYTGGTNMNHFYRDVRVRLIKFDVTSQVTKTHQIKSGAEFKYNEIDYANSEAFYNGIDGGGVFNEEVFFNKGEYNKYPIEGSAYIQDKIELDNMTMNIGLRYDYFNSRGKTPIDMRDPGNSIMGDHGSAVYKDADGKHQFSPRLGMAFPLSDKGVVHASYGHFFQIPTYENLFVNPRFAVAPGGLNTLMGNADLNPQSTVIYELGFQQEFTPFIGMDITGYYRDIRNLLGTEIYETYILGDRYARYENRDYGNVKGITFSFNKKYQESAPFSISIDYTFQTAEGNASDPRQQFINQRNNPPKQSNIQVVPLNWDQRHTVNISFSYYLKELFNFGLVGKFQTGMPYTPEVQSKESQFENSGSKPYHYDFDLQISRSFKINSRLRASTFLKIYNLFDRKNELNVYNDTGRAGYSLVGQYIGERKDYVNTLDEWLKRPDYYSEPRKIIIGFRIEY